MYKEIDELVNAILKDDIFQNYIEQNEKLNENELKDLLYKHQTLQEEYLRLKQYESYVSIEETKEQLKEVKNELSNHPIIQDYYQSYYQLNDLLDEVTHIIFKGVSSEIHFDKWK